MAKKGTYVCGGFRYYNRVKNINNGMSAEEAKKAFDELLAKGESEEDILGVLYTMFQDDAISFDQLEMYTKILGYEITEEFREMSLEDKKTKGYEKA